MLKSIRMYLVYESLNSPTAVDKIPEDEVESRLPSNQVRELRNLRKMKAPFSLYYDEKGNLNLSHRDDAAKYEGLG